MGPWNPHCLGAGTTWIRNLSALPTVTPQQDRAGLPLSVWLCQAWHPGWPHAAPFLQTQLVRSPVRFSNLCRERSLSCNPKEIQTHTCGIWRNHWLPTESIKLHFSLSHVCERHLFPVSPAMEGTHVFLHALIVVMSGQLPSSFTFPLRISASICARVGQPHL